MIKKRILILIFIAWVILWVVFTTRELFHKGQFKEYKTLLGLSLEGKHSHITGKELYELIALASGTIPEGATYKLVGLEPGSLEQRRAAYYLYPAVEAEDPGYIIVYNVPGYKAEGYFQVGKLDDVRVILKKRGAR